MWGFCCEFVEKYRKVAKYTIRKFLYMYICLKKVVK